MYTIHFATNTPPYSKSVALYKVQYLFSCIISYASTLFCTSGEVWIILLFRGQSDIYKQTWSKQHMQIQGKQTHVHEQQVAPGHPYNRLFLHKKETCDRKQEQQISPSCSLSFQLHNYLKLAWQLSRSIQIRLNQIRNTVL